MGPEGPAQREGYSVAEQEEMVARWSVFGKLKGLARICPRPQALYERVIKLDGSASTRRVMELQACRNVVNAVNGRDALLATTPADAGKPLKRAAAACVAGYDGPRWGAA